MTIQNWRNALEQACLQAESYRGATSPNPPVGAAAMNSEGHILSALAHPKAGEPHAEAQVIRDLARRGLLDQVHSMVVTLEPCNHTGRTPPCSEALLKLPNLKRVYFAASDPNPKAQGGAERLSQNGIEVFELGKIAPTDALVERALDLTRPFFHWVRTRRPWVTVKTAWRMTDDPQNNPWSMIPPQGEKTFTSPESLRLAHELRKRADAIVTASGTVLSDWPELTVRHVPDHVGKSRWLAIMDRRRQVPMSWLEQKRAQGFQVVSSQDFKDFPTLLEFLGSQGVLEVMIEAGPTFSEYVLSNGLWDESFRIESRQNHQNRVQDKVLHVYRNY
ncbi:MAG: bifunctional diaminohydroxyphosphoribosylaminopyrimidine deaminase/5-amino-6-(5-phosphoribosylamino)uracil reductase RibD [Bdellovibrionia bacterium]